MLVSKLDHVNEFFIKSYEIQLAFFIIAKYVFRNSAQMTFVTTSNAHIPITRGGDGGEVIRRTYLFPGRGHFLQEILA
jgi:hypothetical protein